MNQVVLNFEECTPAPSMGYRVWWRVAGSGDPLTNVGDFFTSPAVFTDNTNPDGTEYEGYVASNCRGGLGTPQFWTTIESSGSESGGSSGVVEEYAYFLADEYNCSDNCAIPVKTDVLVRILRSELPINFGKWYQGFPEALGKVFQLFGDEQPPGTSILLTGVNTTTCPDCI